MAALGNPKSPPSTVILRTVPFLLTSNLRRTAALTQRLQAALGTDGLHTRSDQAIRSSFRQVDMMVLASLSQIAKHK
jgi:hypothetical protein